MELVSLSEQLEKAPPPLRQALEWFHERRGTEIAWPSPSPIAAMDHLVSAPKGIYKPKGSTVALSVRQTLDSPYADRPVVARPDGSWVYAYHQEGSEPARRDQEYTNVALMQNIQNRTPIAVLLQTKAKPGVRYRVLGLAQVTRWQAGFFYLEGFSEAGFAHLAGTSSELLVLEAEAALFLKHVADGQDDIAPAHDARVRVFASIIQRRGQGQFRSDLLSNYSGTCAITGCQVSAVLEAAHILPYMGDHTDGGSNGLLLRSDIHTLFDSGLIAIDPVRRTVILSERLKATAYGDLVDVRVAEPIDPTTRPSNMALAKHLEWCGERLGFGV